MPTGVQGSGKPKSGVSRRESARMNPLHGAGRKDEFPISMWKLDRLMAGDLPDAEATELRQAIAQSPELQRYVADCKNLKPDLSLDRIRKAARRSGVSMSHADSLSGRIGEFLRSLGSRRGGVAFAFAAALGVGLWTWQARESAPAVIAESGSGYQAKGMDAPGIRLILRGAEYDTSDLVPSRSGDTLGFSYRSPFPISTQIWYREEDKAVEAMLGPSSISEWKPASGWRRATERVILEGQWKHQTIFVVWSKTAFSDEQARRALENGGSTRLVPDMHAEAFRLAWPD